MTLELNIGGPNDIILLTEIFDSVRYARVMDGILKGLVLNRLTSLSRVNVNL
jgi:hypothetical protein